MLGMRPWQPALDTRAGTLTGAGSVRLEDVRAVEADGLEHASFDQQRSHVEPLIDRVVVDGADVEIRYVIQRSTMHSPWHANILRVRPAGDHRGVATSGYAQACLRKSSVNRPAA